MARLRHPVGLEQRHAVDVLEPLHQRRATSPSCTSGRSGAWPARPLRACLSRIIWCRVGPAENQVTPWARRLPPEALRPEAPGHDRRPARRRTRRAPRRRDRGRGRAASPRRTRRSGPSAVVGGDRPRRGDQVPLQQRHLLGPARRAARVQEQRDVVGAARVERLPALDAAVRRLRGRAARRLGDDDVDDRVPRLRPRPWPPACRRRGRAAGAAGDRRGRRRARRRCRPG